MQVKKSSLIGITLILSLSLLVGCACSAPTDPTEPVEPTEPTEQIIETEVIEVETETTVETETEQVEETEEFIVETEEVETEQETEQETESTSTSTPTTEHKQSEETTNLLNEVLEKWEKEKENAHTNPGSGQGTWDTEKDQSKHNW